MPANQTPNAATVSALQASIYLPSFFFIVIQQRLPCHFRFVRRRNVVSCTSVTAEKFPETVIRIAS
jgi:hypothetical protein